MSFESGRKLGLSASLIYVILPVVAVAGAAAFIISIIFSAATGIARGTVAPSFVNVLGGFIMFIVAVAVTATVGFILFMVSMYRLSNYYSEPAIFKNVLYAFILSIISFMIIFSLEFAYIITSILEISQAVTPTAPVSYPLFVLIAVYGASLVFGIINGWLYMRAFNKLKEKSGMGDFGTAGILYLVGVIVPLVAWIAWIFAALGFNKLKLPVTPASYFTQPTSRSMQTKRCPNCGTENPVDALYCTFCGKPL